MQEQNISLSSKEIIPPEPFAFKGFPTNTIRVQEILFLENLNLYFALAQPKIQILFHIPESGF